MRQHPPPWLTGHQLTMHALHILIFKGVNLRACFLFGQLIGHYLSLISTAPKITSNCWDNKVAEIILVTWYAALQSVCHDSQHQLGKFVVDGVVLTENVDRNEEECNNWSTNSIYVVECATSVFIVPFKTKIRQNCFHHS